VVRFSDYHILFDSEIQDMRRLLLFLMLSSIGLMIAGTSQAQLEQRPPNGQRAEVVGPIPGGTGGQIINGRRRVRAGRSAG
jgi:hypothetical protein